jgi:hypothetical protein
MPARSIGLVLITTAFAVIAAAPADAANGKHPKHKKVVVEYSSSASPRCRGDDKFPCGPLYYNGGEYLGDDPDPNIRFQIWRDLGSRFGATD